MVDLHCHILPNVDDGAHSMRETIELLKNAENAGFDTICFTPHYAEPYYTNSKIQNQDILEKVKEEAMKNNISLNLLLGNEIYINENLEELFSTGKITSLSETQYILVELPMYQELTPQIVQKFLEPIVQKGMKIIIAHPERYTYIQENPERIFEYCNENIFFQSNYASILGAYGRDAQKTLKKLLKNKVISYFSTDIHHTNRCFYNDIEKIKKKLRKIVDENYFEILTEKNPRLIIENEIIIDTQNAYIK